MFGALQKFYWNKQKLILFTFFKKKNKNFILGRFSSSTMARPSYARPTRALAPAPALARVARSRGPLALAHSLPLALTNAAAPPVISLLPHSLSSPAAQPWRHSGRPVTTTPVTSSRPTNLTNMINTPRKHPQTSLMTSDPPEVVPHWPWRHGGHGSRHADATSR
jgi:hypothetical protein